MAISGPEDYSKTPAGQLAMAEMMRDRNFTFYSRNFMKMFLDRSPIPHCVYYINGLVIYVDPKRFFFRKPSGPSDCEWMVPGTLERQI